MLIKARSSNLPVGFLDPLMVAKDTIDQDTPLVERYIAAGLLGCVKKEYVLMPFLQNFHWILIVIVPKWNKVYYLDSLSKNKMDFTVVSQVIDR